jgi:hypothetical protein
MAADGPLPDSTVPHPPLELVVCPECWATNAPTASKCWLCGRTAWLAAPAATAAAEPKPNPTAAGTPSEPARPLEPPVGAGLNFNLATLLGVVTLGAVGFGLYSIHQGLGILFVVVMGPAVLVTALAAWARDACVRAQRRTLASTAGSPFRGPADRPEPIPAELVVRPLTAGQKAGIFVGTAATMLGTAAVFVVVIAIVAILAVLAFVAAFFEMCQKLLGGG